MYQMYSYTLEATVSVVKHWKIFQLIECHLKVFNVLNNYIQAKWCFKQIKTTLEVMKSSGMALAKTLEVQSTLSRLVSIWSENNDSIQPWIKFCLN